MSVRVERPSAAKKEDGTKRTLWKLVELTGEDNIMTKLTIKWASAAFPSC